MKVGPLFFLLALSAATAPGQSSGPIADSITHSSAIGFSYSLPADWQVVDSPAPAVASTLKQPGKPNAMSQDQQRGVTCAQVAFTGRRGDPASAIVVVQIPFVCLGQAATAKDLPGLAQGASAQLRQQFNFAATAQRSYWLGSHSMWAQRSRGTQKVGPKTPYTVEIVCTILKDGAVCWMVIAPDEASLNEFEQGQVALEQDTPTALVPPKTLSGKPSP